MMNILSAAARYGMFANGDKILVAVSGGPDSVSMLHALHIHSEEFGITLHIAHLNHSIRGAASDLDEQFVRELAHQFGVPATIEKVDVPALKNELKLGEEEAARQARYDFLQRVAKDIGANKIAVGHTADDRAESVLLNVIRGTGIDGLGAIRPIRGNIIRPLIETWRHDIDEYILEHQLPYRVDESNIDIAYTRNRVRHELIPHLERSYNPNIKQALLRLAEIADSSSEFINNQAAQFIYSVTYHGAIDVGLFLELPMAIQYQIIRLEIERHKGNLLDVSLEQIQRVIAALKTEDKFAITLQSGRIYAIRDGNKFRICPKAKPPKVEPFDIEIAVPGKTTIPQIGCIIEAEIVDSVESLKTSPNIAVINADAVVGKLRVRNIRPGDKIMPFGMHETKKLQDVFVDKKIPRADRAHAAVVIDDKKILWVVGVIASEAVRVTQKTRSIIRLSVIKQPTNTPS